MSGKRWRGSPKLTLIVFSCMCFFAAGCLVFTNHREDAQAKAASSNVLESIVDRLPEEAKKAYLQTDSPLPTAAPSETQAPHERCAIPKGKMPVLTIDNEGYLGFIFIPSIGIKLPVMCEWSYDALKKTPCLFAGSIYGRNAVIAAHNYSSHFGGLIRLSQGDQVSFFDTAGNEFKYTVSLCEILQPTAIAELVRGDFELSLFTCTVGGQSRYTVRCTLEQVVCHTG